MKKLTLACVAPLLALVLANVASAAYLETDSVETVPRQDQPPRILPPQPVVPPPFHNRNNALVDLVRRVDIGNSYSYRGLTVYPLLARNRETATDILTLDEALYRGELSIREKGDGQVPFVQVRNEGHHPVLLMTGEILVGGRQNRVIRDDVLLSTRSEFIDIPVYCGEQDRWKGDGITFKSGSTMIAPGMREMSATAAPQDHIWREIDGKLRQAEVKSDTRSYQAYFDDNGVKRRLDDCVRQFRGCRTRQTLGLVAVYGNRILGCDLFADPAICARLWDKILRSYGGDVIIQPRYRDWDERGRQEKWAPGIGSEDVQRLLDRTRAADFDERSTVGIGRLYRISGGVTGNVLINAGEVVHAAIFTGGREVILPQPLMRENVEGRTR